MGKPKKNKKAEKEEGSEGGEAVWLSERSKGGLQCTEKITLTPNAQMKEKKKAP